MRLPAVALAVVVLAGCADVAPDAPLATDGADVASGTAVARNNGTATLPSDMTGGHAPHIHDYWGENDRVVAFDDVVDVSAFRGETFYNVFLRGDPAAGGRFWTFPEGQTVYEGTGAIEVTASWTDPTITGLGLAWKSADQPATRNQFRETTPLASGETVVIDVEPRMTDMPHEAVTRWEFYFAATGTPALAQGEFHLRVELVRMRDVSLFPGHPDMYQDVDRYVLEDAEFAYTRPSLASFFLQSIQGRDTTPIVPDRPVPMETRVLVVEVTISSADAGAPGTETSGYDLVYRTAAGERFLAQPLGEAAPRYTFGIPVEDSDVDSPYGEASAWRLAPMPRTQGALPVACEFCVDVETTGHVVITAYAEDPTGQISRERQPI